MATLPVTYDKCVVHATYDATIDATYNGWTINQYDTSAYAGLVGIGTATIAYTATCGSELPVRCTDVDLGLPSQTDSGSLLIEDVGASAAFSNIENPILYPFGDSANVHWDVLSGGKCARSKHGTMSHTATLAIFEEKSTDNFCCGTHFDYTHTVTAIASGITASSHNVRMTRCASGTGNTILDIDIDTSVGLCTDFTLLPPAGPWPRFGWMGKVIYKVRTPGGTLLMTGHDWAMYAGGGFGSPARGGRLAGSFGSALDTIIASTTPNTGGTSTAATGVITLSDSSVNAYLDAQPAFTVLDVEMQISMGSFTQTGDANGDNKSNWDDRRAHVAAWGTTYDDPAYNPALDFNADGVINQADYFAQDGAWNAFATCKADCGQTGGIVGSDGAVDNNDWTVFINRYFAADDDADIGKTGGAEGADGTLDNNDFIVFINWFFGSCN